MKKVSVLLVAAMVAVFAGCAGGPKKPDWVMKGAAAFKDGKKVMYGVGIAENIKSEALRRTTADNRAIAEVSKQISTMSTSLMRDYMASTADVNAGASKDEQNIENTIKTFASNTLSGVEIVDRFESNNVMYSLAKLDIEKLKSMADESKTLGAGVANYIKANADKAFDKLEAEQTKQGK